VLERPAQHRLAALQLRVHPDVVEREAGLHGEELEQLAGVRVGAQRARRQIHRQHAEQAALGAVQGREEASSGCQACSSVLLGAGGTQTAISAGESRPASAKRRPP
jgi:hypothetical protein